MVDHDEHIREELDITLAMILATRPYISKALARLQKSPKVF